MVVEGHCGLVLEKLVYVVRYHRSEVVEEERSNRVWVRGNDANRRKREYKM